MIRIYLEKGKKNNKTVLFQKNRRESRRFSSDLSGPRKIRCEHDLQTRFYKSNNSVKRNTHASLPRSESKKKKKHLSTT